jgi:hypothetical protein
VNSDKWMIRALAAGMSLDSVASWILVRPPHFSNVVGVFILAFCAWLLTNEVRPFTPRKDDKWPPTEP